jgi:hypothetical protein
MDIESESQGSLPMMSSAVSPVIPKPGSFRYESQQHQHQALHAQEDAACKACAVYGFAGLFVSLQMFEI